MPKWDRNNLSDSIEPIRLRTQTALFNSQLKGLLNIPFNKTLNCQTVQTLIITFLCAQSDLGLHCLISFLSVPLRVIQGHSSTYELQKWCVPVICEV